MSQPESRLVAEIRLALGREPDVVLWRLTQGAGEIRPGEVRRFGLTPGAADILAIVAVRCGERVIGRWLALEAKSATGRQSPEQRSWGAIIERLGGVYAVVRSVEDARAALARARNR